MAAVSAATTVVPYLLRRLDQEQLCCKAVVFCPQIVQQIAAATQAKGWTVVIDTHSPAAMDCGVGRSTVEVCTHTPSMCCTYVCSMSVALLHHLWIASLQPPSTVHHPASSHGCLWCWLLCNGVKCRGGTTMWCTLCVLATAP